MIGVDPIQSVRQYPDGLSLHFQRLPMRNGIDSLGQATYDHDVLFRQFLNDLFRQATSLFGGLAGANDGLHA